MPLTAGEGGYWDTFDWESAMARGATFTGLQWSGKMGFAPTEMYWPLSHMVMPEENALSCVDCHGRDGRMDWKALGYEGDPIVSGGRK